MKTRKKRYHSGENNPAAKLTDADITDIRRRWCLGEKQSVLAIEYSVSAAHISRVLSGHVRGSFVRPQDPMPDGARLVVGWSGYCVTPDGDVYSNRTNGSRNTKNWTKLKKRTNVDGYGEVHLCNGDKTKVVRVHTLVLLTFVGDKPEGAVACHNNGVRDDNRVSNLKWGTPQDNADDRNIHGNTARGERSGAAKLTQTAVDQIRMKRKEGRTLESIAKEFGVNKRTVGRIVHGLTWRHSAPKAVPVHRAEVYRKIKGRKNEEVAGGETV